jgi:hypothetical protein
MKREIYQVDAYIVDANGTFNRLDGHPRLFDSKNYSHDLAKTYTRANGAYCEAVAAMSKIDTRQLQIATLMIINSGNQLAVTKIGELADLPDPEPAQS